MSQTYELNNGYSIADKDGKLLIKKDGIDEFIINGTKVFRTNTDSSVPLNISETKELCLKLLKSEFEISDDMSINAVNLKQSSDQNFSLQIDCGTSDDSTKIELVQNNDAVELNNTNYNLQLTRRGTIVSEHAIQSLNDKSERKYKNVTKITEKIHSEKIVTENRILFSRAFKNNGHRVVLDKEFYDLDELEFLYPTTKKTRVEIASDEISKQDTIDGEKYKQKLKITYDLKEGVIKCQLKRRDYDAITITEYKPTILTHATGKKVRVTTFWDRDFDGNLEMAADGSFIYKQSRTGNDGRMEKLKTTTELGKVHATILQAVEKIKATASKIAIVRNSQGNPKQINFAQNPALFDDEINFAEVKDHNELKITDNLKHGNATIHRHLLFVLAQLHKHSNNNVLPLNKIDGNGR